MQSECPPRYVRLTNPGFTAPPGTWNPAECPILYTINGVRPRDHEHAMRIVDSINHTPKENGDE